MDKTMELLADRIAGAIMDTIEFNGRIARADLAAAVHAVLLTDVAGRSPVRAYEDGYAAGLSAGRDAVLEGARAETERGFHPMGLENPYFMHRQRISVREAAERFGCAVGGDLAEGRDETVLWSAQQDPNTWKRV